MAKKSKTIQNLREFPIRESEIREEEEKEHFEVAEMAIAISTTN